jgi:hypothetical protein
LGLKVGDGLEGAVTWELSFASIGHQAEQFEQWADKDGLIRSHSTFMRWAATKDFTRGDLEAIERTVRARAWQR